ncbi:nucleotidyltransferase domain-containing protein [Austwickia chelonae]|uniref:nucleotidyltransferase domain-containing protein n=1 Tax=Austwickia chelonae TaxID=100225 RepID=UPI0013C2D73F|nr:nucleotidyltransferase domain-containing protein [Austwickia chelonae]
MSQITPPPGGLLMDARVGVVMIGGMRTWITNLPYQEELSVLADRVEQDVNVVGVLLTGSHAHGLATSGCDVDLHVLLAEKDDSWRPMRQGGLDLQVHDAQWLRRVPSDPSRWWDRYRIARGMLVADRSEGALGDDLRGWGTLSLSEQADAIDFALTPYLTYAMRSLYEFSTGELTAARLDAAENLPWALRLMFAVQGRPRPTNRYLAWELEYHPLTTPAWQSEWVLGIVEALRCDGSPAAQRELFAAMEPPLRALGFGGVLDGDSRAVTLLQA